MTTQKTITRFAPSPSGLLHLGHAYSALFAEKEAKDQNGTFLLRFEDIDPKRCHEKYENKIIEDLNWLNIYYQGPIRRQSEHMHDYIAAIEKLAALKLIYPCFLSRKELNAALSAPHFISKEKTIDSRAMDTDRHLSEPELKRRMETGAPYALRLRMQAALKLVGPIYWEDKSLGKQTAQPEIFGDVVLARKDIPTSYHLSVTIDDALQGITTITRGDDLFFATHLHRLLQELLNLPVPSYNHHRVLKDRDGNRLAKRDESLTLEALRNSGKTPTDIRNMVGF